MAADAILNLLSVVSISLTRPVSGCTSLIYSCQTSQMYLNQRLRYCVLWKFKMAAADILDFVLTKI